MPEFPIENPKHIAKAFPEMEAKYPRLYQLLEWRTGYALAEPNETQREFLAFVEEQLEDSAERRESR